MLAVSGALLTLLAISFAGAGIHGLVQAGYLPSRPVAFPDLPWNPVLVLAPKVSALILAQLFLWFFVLRRDERAAVQDWIRDRRKALPRKSPSPPGVGDEGFEPPTSSL